MKQLPIYIILLSIIAISQLQAQSADREKIVEQFKKMYQRNLKDIFTSNPELFKKYNNMDGMKIEDWEDFKNFINDERLSINHPIFNFIKTE